MMNTVFPTDLDEVADIVRQGRPLEVIGLGSKRGFGRPVTADTCLSTERLCGVLFYEPDEMVLSVRAGTRLSTLQALLAEHRQRLPFEPPCWNSWLSPDHKDQTIGGVIACNLSGSQRLSAGAARDHLLGFQGINGRGEIFKSGGRVVKNVTGYDLSKLMAGSFGTLAVLGEVTLRTLPAAECEGSVLLPIDEPGAAVQCISEVLGSSCEVTAAAWLPEALGEEVNLQGNVAVLRLEGLDASLKERATRIHRKYPVDGTVIESHASAKLWRDLSDGVPLARYTEAAIWRISIPPASADAVLRHLPAGDAWLDWAGGLIWLAVPDDNRIQTSAAEIRDSIAACGGHATLVRARESTRKVVPVFQPRPKAHAALLARIKDAFDPDALLNPERMN